MKKIDLLLAWVVMLLVWFTILLAALLASFFVVSGGHL